MITPCWDQLFGGSWDTCLPTYFRAIIFIACGLCTLMLGTYSVLRYRTIDRFITMVDAGAVMDIRQSHANLQSLLLQATMEMKEARQSVHTLPSIGEDGYNTMTSMWQKVPGVTRVCASIKKFHSLVYVGSKYFWYRAMFNFVGDVFVQIAFGFLIDQSLALASAGLTIAQTCLILIHCYVVLYAIHQKSETMFFLLNFILEFGYLGIRFSLRGSLSMATTDMWDFLTLFIPLLKAIFEVIEVSDYILNKVNRRNAGGGSRNTLYGNNKHPPKSFRLGTWSFIMSTLFVLTAVAFVVIGLCIYKGYVQGCPSVDPEMEIDIEQSRQIYGDLHALQWQVDDGMFCFAWVFNLFLSPGCSCFFVQLEPISQGVSMHRGYDFKEWWCAGFGENNQTALKPYLPYFEHVRFVFIDMPFSNECALNQKDFELIASWKYLRVLRCFGFRGQELPEVWKKLENLAAIELITTRIENLNLDVIESWSRLEYFACTFCPHLKNIDALDEASLPRLNQVDVYGAHRCPNLSPVVSMTCVSQTARETCTGIPQWILQVFLDNSARTTTTKCLQPTCSSFMQFFRRRDMNQVNHILKQPFYKNIAYFCSTFCILVFKNIL